MRITNVAVLLALCFCMSDANLAQDRSWRQYSGNVFSFSYPGTWQLHSQVNSDAVVADTANPISVEFANSPGDGASQEKLVLNAEAHVAQFARANHMAAKFESWNQIDAGTVRVISHVCSDQTYADQHHCRPDDPKAIDVSTATWNMNGRVFLIEMMHKPGLSEATINVGRQIVGTFKING